MGILNVRFDFNDEEGLFEYENKEGRHKLAFGFGKHNMQKFPVDYSLVNIQALQVE
jgi:hypothetical protein